MEKTVQNIPFLRITIALSTGIILGLYINPGIWFLTIIPGVILLFLFFLHKNYRFSLSTLFGAVLQLFFVLTGFYIIRQFNQKPVFYNNGSFLATVIEVPQEKPNSYKSVIQVEAVFLNDSSKKTCEKLIVYFEKDTAAAKLEPGVQIIFKGVPQLVTNNQNPYEFDYSKYLAQKQIYRQVYLPANKWVQTGNQTFLLICEAEKIREKLLKIYRSLPFDENEYEILLALTIGYKRDLDPETRRVFSASGTMHVLAVSGMHVAIIFWVFVKIFGFLRKRKSGQILFVVIVVFLLWFYALITGLSASVLRATAMFTLVVIGDSLNRKPAIYNTLAASAFFLLLFNPNNLFDIGFQLSYAAVFGIVFLQPRFDSLLNVKSKIARYFWSLITVSVAAQIATFPITTYYFGQFPTYFIITNFVILPAVAILIPLGIGLLLVANIPILSTFLAILLNYSIKYGYKFLAFIEQLPYAVIHVSVNSIQLALLAGTLIFAFFYISGQRVVYIKLALSLLLLLSISTLYTEINNKEKNRLIVYNSTKNAILHLIRGHENYVISDEKITATDLYFSPVAATRQKLGLNAPVFLTASEKYSDQNLILQNGIIFFEGQTIIFRQEISSNIDLPIKCLFINPPLKENIDLIGNSAVYVITDKRYLSPKWANLKHIHNTSKDGAFLKNW